MYYLFPKLSEIIVENVSITLIRVTGDTAQKMKFSIKDFSNKCDKICRKLDLVTFTGEIFNGKLHFLCSEDDC